MSLQEQKSVTLKIENQNAFLTINRPDYLNALNPDVLVSILNSLQEISQRSDIRTVTITGAGEKAFVAGADIASMNGLGPRAIADYIELGQRTMRAIETFDLPVIAIVNGFALGGGMELALSCDLIISSDNAKFGQPEVNLGIIPGFGGTQRILYRAGIGVAKRLCLTAEIITAQEALSLGLVDRVFPKDDLISESLKICALIASKAPLAVKECKKVINYGAEQSLKAGLRTEVESFLKIFETQDRQEGMQAFLQKRTANFTGK